MRKIKFRVWDKENKEFIHINIPQDGCINEDQFRGINRVGLGAWTQYTGYIDEDGKEIYQGDIIQWSSDDPDDGTETWFVDPETFIGGFFAHSVEDTLVYPLQDPSFANSDPMNNTMTFFRVIGNIYENPELLEDK